MYSQLKKIIAGDPTKGTTVDDLIGSHHPHVKHVFEDYLKPEQDVIEVGEFATGDAEEQLTTEAVFGAEDETQKQYQQRRRQIDSNDHKEEKGEEQQPEEEEEPDYQETVLSVFGDEGEETEVAREEVLKAQPPAAPHLARIQITIPVSPMEMPEEGTEDGNELAGAAREKEKHSHVMVDLVTNNTTPTLQDAVNKFCRDARTNLACERITLLTTHQHMLQQAHPLPHDKLREPRMEDGMLIMFDEGQP